MCTPVSVNVDQQRVICSVHSSTEEDVGVNGCFNLNSTSHSCCRLQHDKRQQLRYTNTITDHEAFFTGQK